MKNNNMPYRYVIVIILSVIITLGCGPGPHDTDPPSLVGDYKGSYRLIVNGPPDTVSQAILLTLEASSYSIAIDTSSPDLTALCLCETQGTYKLDTGLVFYQDSTGVPDGIVCSSCNDKLSIEGSFSMNKSLIGDTLLMQQTKGDSTTLLLVNRQ